MTLLLRDKALSLFLLELAACLVASTVRAEIPMKPDPAKTPGDVLTTDAARVCAQGYAKAVGKVPKSLEDQVYRSYGITSRQPGAFQLDNLISVELGGSNSARNLWPQSYVTRPLNARLKDQLENKLHELVCSGKLPIGQAQHDIATDWGAAYQRYVGPLPLGDQSPSSDNTSISDQLPGVSPRHARPVSDAESVPRTAVPPAVNASEPAYPPWHPDAAGHCPPSVPVKVSQNKVYYVPGSPNYERIKAKRCFASAESAQEGGFRPPKR